MPKILLVDDDVELTSMLIEYIQQEGLEGLAVHNGNDGLREALGGSYDIIVLDVMMPNISGLDLLRRIRKEKNTPVLMLTARGDHVDKIAGLDLGADDYVAKPCTPGELLARIRAILRRTEMRDKEERVQDIQVGSLRLSAANRSVTCEGRTINLTGVEFNVLEVLVRNAGRLVSKQDLSLRALGAQLTPFDRRLDVHVSSIRQKLGRRADGRPWIHTVRGTGYQMIGE